MTDDTDTSTVTRCLRITCSFNLSGGGGRTYDYKSHDLTIEVGDIVLVPAGRNNEPKEVLVMEVSTDFPKHTAFEYKWVINKVQPPADEEPGGDFEAPMPPIKGVEDAPR